MRVGDSSPPFPPPPGLRPRPPADHHRCFLPCRSQRRSNAAAAAFRVQNKQHEMAQGDVTSLREQSLGALLALSGGHVLQGFSENLALREQNAALERQVRAGEAAWREVSWREARALERNEGLERECFQLRARVQEEVENVRHARTRLRLREEDYDRQISRKAEELVLLHKRVDTLEKERERHVSAGGCTGKFPFIIPHRMPPLASDVCSSAAVRDMRRWAREKEAEEEESEEAELARRVRERRGPCSRERL